MSNSIFKFPSKNILSKFIDEVVEYYGIGESQEWGIFEGGSNGSLWVSTLEKTFVIRFVTETRNHDRFILEYDVVNKLGDAGIPVSRIIAALDGSIVTATDLFGWVSEFALYERLEGDIYRYNDITIERINEAIKTVAKMHNVLLNVDLDTNITSHIYLFVALQNMVGGRLEALLQSNHQGCSCAEIAIIKKWWSTHEEEMEYLVNSYLSKSNKIIHGDLNPSNFVFSGNTYGLIDFERIGLAPVEWDIAYALGAWASDQKILTKAEFYALFKTAYCGFNNYFVWDDGQMVSLLRVFYLSLLYAGLEKPRPEELMGSLQNRKNIYYEGIKGITQFDEQYDENILSR